MKKGTIVTSPHWPEPVEIKFIEESGDYYHIIGATTKSSKHIDDLIPKSDIENYKILEEEKLFSEEPWKIFLGLESIRYRFASLYDPLLAMNTSKVDPLPHQIEAVYGYVLKLPRIRFLIADDPGAGKTIMAGLIIKELKLRNTINRILIVSPGHLKDQWRRELSERFEEKFIVVDRSTIDALYAENVWKRERQVITSIDFAKRDEILPSIAAAQFDLIIVDEAHKMSAYRYGDKTEKTGRYRLGETLSKVTDHLLFLTATPHKGDPENFRLFLDLLVPGFFSSNEMLQESIKNQDNPLFIRRIKEDLKDFEGKPLFLPRNVDTVPFDLGSHSPNEKDLYNELSKYVETQYNKALTRDKKRNVAFALVILQRRFASSTYALQRSLERRVKRLQDLLSGAEQFSKNNQIDIDEYDEMSEEDRWEAEEIWETLSVAENREELEKEIEILKGLIEKAKNIVKNEEEIKLKEFRGTLDNLYSKYQKSDDKKILVFTESRDTLEYLQSKIIDWGYKVNTIHGGMKLEERVKAEKVFKNETNIMVATEAAGEGINLQFCNMMINYDIPWNPNRLEQRMGRIHRYGQRREVFIYNLVASDTREGRVLGRLFAKLEEIKDTLGSDKVFDVLGEVLLQSNLSQLLSDAAANARSIDEILASIDIKVDDDYINKVKTNLGESLATRFIDYTRIKELNAKAREHRLIPEYTENFFKKAFVKAGGKFNQLNDGFISIPSIPFELRKIAELDDIKQSYGALLKKYPKVTFDKQKAFENPETEFITFGHPLFESVMMWIEQNYIDLLSNGTVFIDPDGLLKGEILFYEGEIKDGVGNIAGKRLFSFFVSGDEIKPVHPSIIWDLLEADPTQIKSTDDNIDLEKLRADVSNNIIKELEVYKSELQQERVRQADIKQKYGVKSLENLIVELDGQLIDLHDRKAKGENVDLAIRNKEERLNGYERAKKELINLIEREKRLTMGMPKFKAIIKVIPNQIIDDMVSSEEIEKIGMDVSMQFEADNGRFPEDVSKQNLGFDIRSKIDTDAFRYIEVKARAGLGAVSLTQNEWFKAQRFGEDYYLYIVLNAASKPQLHIVRNPAKHLTPEQKIDVRYIIPLNEIENKGVKN
ncbi:MAG: helicase-related protein [Melioribacteraceae bacterium]|nr:helicase-related protein [Melioribacteraceae bacterium]